MHQDKNLKQTTIDQHFEQQHLGFQIEAYEKAKKTAVECIRQAVTIAAEWNLKAKPTADTTQVRRKINRELFAVEQALNLVPNNDPDREKINDVRLSLLASPFTTPPDYPALISQFFGLEVESKIRSVSGPDLDVNFQGVPLERLVQRSFPLK